MAATAESAAPSSRKNHLVVAIDDDERILSALERSLRHEAYVLRVTTDPRALLGWVTADDVSLVIADQRMPEIAGTDLLEEIRNRAPGTNRMILTGYADAEVIRSGIDESTQWLVSKPWSETELRRTIRFLLHERECENWRRDVFRAETILEGTGGAELDLPVECRHRTGQEIMASVESVLRRAGREYGTLRFELLNLPELRDSIPKFLARLVMETRGRGFRVRIVDASGFAYSFVSSVHRTPPFEGVEVAIRGIA